MDIWKEIPNYPKYKASNTGHIRSYCNKEPIILKPSKDRWGYYHLTVRNKDGGKPHFVHKLVLLAFVGPRPEGYECRHLDGNKENNRLDNLCWGHKFDNVRDQIAHGKLVTNKLTEEQVLEIRHLCATKKYTHSKLANTYNVSQSHIGRIANRTRWRHL